MTKMAAFPTTLMEAVMHFANPDLCHEYLKGLKWPDDHVTCPACGGDSIGEIKSRRMFQCKAKECRKQFSVKVGTIFEDSPLPLQKWFVAVWSVTNAKNGISSCELARAIGITQKSAWFMLHRIRLAMKSGTFRRIEGEIEADETYVGGLAKNMHKARRERVITGTGGSGKTIVMGLLERGAEGRRSRVKAKVVPNARKKTVQPEVRENVASGSRILTDALRSYQGLDPAYAHEVVDHAIEYVRGTVHTSGMENFWTLLKRTLKGTYVAVAPIHLDRYLDEQTFRFNEREGGDGGRFQTVMGSVTGRRITYKQLVAKS